jgi:hypothetical protein
MVNERLTRLGGVVHADVAADDLCPPTAGLANPAGWLRVTAAATSFSGGVEQLSHAEALATGERLHLESVHIPNPLTHLPSDGSARHASRSPPQQAWRDKPQPREHPRSHAT